MRAYAPVLNLMTAVAGDAAKVTYYKDVLPILHRAAIFVRTPESKTKCLADLKPGEPYGTKNRRWFIGRTMFDAPCALPPGQAKLIRAGSDIIFEIHYTANGKPGTDRSHIGLVFSKDPPTEHVHSLTISGAGELLDAAGRQAGQPESAPHMHLRGKSFEFRAIYPTGESETLLRVPNYSFSWQLYYYLAEQKILPGGTRIECTGRYDNSPNNPNNPDPTREVRC